TVLAGFATAGEATGDQVENVRRMLHDPAIHDPDFLEMFLRGPKMIYAAALERRERDPVYLAPRELMRHVASVLDAHRRAGPATTRLGRPAYDAASPDRFAGAVAAHVLGTGVHSRIGTFIRTQKGYAYTFGADFVATRTYGYFSAAARTDAETAADTVATMLD